MKLSGHVVVTYGKPLRFDRFAGKDRDRFVLRSVTDEVLYEIMVLTGQEYVDEYATKVKNQLRKQAAEAARPAEPATKPTEAVPEGSATADTN